MDQVLLSDENAPNAVISYYAKGALAALALIYTSVEKREIKSRWMM